MERAPVIFDGTPLIERRFDFGRPQEMDFVLFRENKAITSSFLRRGSNPITI